MARLVWGVAGSRGYETGVDRGVLYPPNSAIGVPWNGLTSVDEKPSGGEPQPFYLDGVKYLQIANGEEFAATLSAYSSPIEFGPCDGTSNIYAGLFITQQPRKQFGLTYRSLRGNDVNEAGYGYKIHLVYNALAKPSTRSNSSIADTTEVMELSWDISTIPPAITGFKPSAHLVIDSVSTDPAHLTAIENILYGSDADNPRLPDVSEILTIFGS